VFTTLDVPVILDGQFTSFVYSLLTRSKFLRRINNEMEMTRKESVVA
jgi:hypothetical protein